MRWLKRTARFYAEHPWSTALVVFWVASTICGVRVFTGTPFAFQFATGQIFVSWFPNFLERATPVGPEVRPGWHGGWGHFVMLLPWFQFESMRSMYTLLVPAWLIILLPRVFAAITGIRASRQVVNMLCLDCRYDMPAGVPVCPECGADAPTTKPTKCTIVLRELKTFGMLVALPLATMTLMAIIGTFI